MSKKSWHFYLQKVKLQLIEIVEIIRGVLKKKYKTRKQNFTCISLKYQVDFVSKIRVLQIHVV